MRTKQAKTRMRIIEAAYESFWRLGFARTSVDSIAARAGLTKRTLYSYFPSKDDLLAAVLQRYSELAAERLQHIADRLPADRYGMVDSLFGQLAGWASATHRWSGSGFTRLVVELAHMPGHPARAIARDWSRDRGTLSLSRPRGAHWMRGLPLLPIAEVAVGS